jgi:L-ribulose-5-phosphate 3-epimerase
MPNIDEFEIGVCSWSLQVKSIPELKGFVDRLGLRVVQIACGDPHHASWDEGDAMPQAAVNAGFVMSGAMLGFPGEDYTTPQSIERTGGFGDPATRDERMDVLRWGLVRTRKLGLSDLMFHAGFIPPLGDDGRSSFLDTLAKAADLARRDGVTIAFETGQEPSYLLRETLDDLRCDNVKINFDPANVLLYDMDNPHRAIELLAPDIRSVHMKDAIRPTVPGTWGTEVPLGQGHTDTREVVRILKKIGYRGPLCIEREVGDQAARFADIQHGVRVLQDALRSL